MSNIVIPNTSNTNAPTKFSLWEILDSLTRAVVQESEARVKKGNLSAGDILNMTQAVNTLVHTTSEVLRVDEGIKHTIRREAEKREDREIEKKSLRCKLFGRRRNLSWE